MRGDVLNYLSRLSPSKLNGIRTTYAFLREYLVAVRGRSVDSALLEAVYPVNIFTRKSILTRLTTQYRT